MVTGNLADKQAERERELAVLRDIQRQKEQAEQQVRALQEERDRISANKNLTEAQKSRLQEVATLFERAKQDRRTFNKLRKRQSARISSTERVIRALREKADKREEVANRGAFLRQEARSGRDATSLGDVKVAARRNEAEQRLRATGRRSEGVNTNLRDSTGATGRVVTDVKGNVITGGSAKEFTRSKAQEIAVFASNQARTKSKAPLASKAVVEKLVSDAPRSAAMSSDAGFSIPASTVSGEGFAAFSIEQKRVTGSVQPSREPNLKSIFAPVSFVERSIRSASTRSPEGSILNKAGRKTADILLPAARAQENLISGFISPQQTVGNQGVQSNINRFRADPNIVSFSSSAGSVGGIIFRPQSAKAAGSALGKASNFIARQSSRVGLSDKVITGGGAVGGTLLAGAGGVNIVREISQNPQAAPLTIGLSGIDVVSGLKGFNREGVTTGRVQNLEVSGKVISNSVNEKGIFVGVQEVPIIGEFVRFGQVTKLRGVTRRDFGFSGTGRVVRGGVQETTFLQTPKGIQVRTSRASLSADVVSGEVGGLTNKGFPIASRVIQNNVNTDAVISRSVSESAVFNRKGTRAISSSQIETIRPRLIDEPSTSFVRSSIVDEKALRNVIDVQKGGIDVRFVDRGIARADATGGFSAIADVQVRSIPRRVTLRRPGVQTRSGFRSQVNIAENFAGIPSFNRFSVTNLGGSFISLNNDFVSSPSSNSLITTRNTLSALSAPTNTNIFSNQATSFSGPTQLSSSLFTSQDGVGTINTPNTLSPSTPRTTSIPRSPTNTLPTQSITPTGGFPFFPVVSLPFRPPSGSSSNNSFFNRYRKNLSQYQTSFTAQQFGVKRKKKSTKGVFTGFEIRGL